MAVRVRYRPNELGETGVVEIFYNADGWREDDDGNIILTRTYETDEGESRRSRVGVVKADRWDSVMVEESAEG